MVLNPQVEGLAENGGGYAFLIQHALEKRLFCDLLNHLPGGGQNRVTACGHGRFGDGRDSVIDGFAH